MADYRATSTEFTAVADAIRTKGGTSAQLTWPNGFVSAVQEIPTGSGVVQPLSVTQNGTYNPPSGVDGYAPVTVNVSGGGSSFLTPDYQGLAWSYVITDGGYYSDDVAKKYYSNYFHVLANKTYCLFIGSVTSDRIRCHFYANKNISDFEEYIDNPMPNIRVYTCTNNISGTSDLTQYNIRFLFTPSSDGEIVFVTSRSSVSANAYCVEMP